jgi:GNAT superfamily N-acetyltransferase
MNGAARLPPSSIVVRAASAEDNEALLKLFRRCPMQADISLTIERDPDFFALSRARGDTDTYIAEIDGALIGCLSAWRRDAWIGRQPGRVCYIGDLRVSPEHRRRGVALQLGKAMRNFQSELPVVPYLLATGDGNSAVAPVAAAFGAVGQPIARLTSWQLLPVVRLKLSTAMDIGAAEERDLGELTRLLDEFYRSRDFAPVFGDGGLQRLIASSPGANLSDYLVARRKGRLLAVLGVWDASAVKRTRIVAMPLWLRGLCAIGRGASRLAPLPPFPRQGTLLHFRYIRHAAFASGEALALQNLVRGAMNAARDRGEHFVLYTCEDTDALHSAVANLPRLSFRYRITPFQFPENAPYFSGQIRPSTWCFDDAALA